LRNIRRACAAIQGIIAGITAQIIIAIAAIQVVIVGATLQAIGIAAAIKLLIIARSRDQRIAPGSAMELLISTVPALQAIGEITAQDAFNPRQPVIAIRTE
jgi:hypothetical protein